MDIDVREYQESGYKPVVDYMEWRVAVLNYCELIRYRICKNIWSQMRSSYYLKEAARYSQQEKERILEILSRGKWSHLKFIM